MEYFFTLCKLCCCWFNKNTDRPVATEDKVSRGNQIKSIVKKKSGVGGIANETLRGSSSFKMKER